MDNIIGKVIPIRIAIHPPKDTNAEDERQCGFKNMLYDSSQNNYFTLFFSIFANQ